MDVPIAGSAAWLVLGTVLGVLLAAAVVTAVLAARRRTPPPPSDAVPAPRVDDLADFLEHPPGTRPAEPAAGGWAALAPAPPPPAPIPARPADDRGLRPLPVLALTALVLVGIAAAVAAGSRAPDRDDAARPSASEPAPTSPAGGTEGRLTGGGLVLEQRAVGITVTYPELRLATDGGTGRLELRLPTWNCLAAAPPEDPAAAGCVPSLVEHAELTSPELVVERDGDRLLVRGPAATVLRPAGAAPEPTGRVYDVELTVEGADGAAVGEVRIGTGTTPVAGELSGR